MSERIFVRKLDQQLWQWRVASATGKWLSDTFYTGDINLLAESIAGATVTLILPGQRVVSQTVETDLKDRRLLAKVIPYQIEDDIVDSIEELAFAYGPITDGQLPVVYVDEPFAAEVIAELEALGADVKRCVVDYIELARDSNQWLLIQDGETLLVANGLLSGFVVEKDLAALYLTSACAENPPENVLLVAEDEESLAQLTALLPAELLQNENLALQKEVGGFWDFLKTQTKPLVDFRLGRLARKLPFAEWWRQWKIPASAATAAFLLALLASWSQLNAAKKAQRQIFAERDAMFRQVVTGNGPIQDPVRTLKGKLGNTNQGESSRLIAMMSFVGPVMATNKDVKLTSFHYAHDGGELLLSLEAKDIATLEALRSKIAEAGLVAEIKRASVSGEINQAQMRITEGKS